MPRLRIALLLALLAATTASAARRRAVGGDPWPAHPLLDAARRANASQYEFARGAGAHVLLADDGSTFALYWSPNADPHTPLIVTLHGSEAFATAEFFHWHPHATERGYALLALQWWMGEPERYLDDAAIYTLVSQMLERVSASHGRVLLHGFSRGAARSYAVAFLDRRTTTPWFALTIANSGGAQSTYPLYAEIDQGRYGSSVFAGTRWILYCGANDPNPQMSGCPAMRATQSWLTQHGGEIVLAIEDPAGGHGGFEQNPDNIRRALDAFAMVLSSATIPQ